MLKQYLFITLILFAALCHAQVIETTGSKVSPQEAQAALEYHNKVRKDVRSEPLIWSTELAAYAQAWAEEIAKTGCKMRHRPGSGEWAQKYGENIFWGSPARFFTPQVACENWYSEIKYFKNQKISVEKLDGVGHYTQMVWNTTKAVGIGKAVCKNDALIVVANYDPPGNVIGLKPY